MTERDAAAREMRQEHDRLAQRIESAQAAAAAIIPLDTPLEQTRLLREELAEHFGLEEQGGYMHEIADVRPDLIERIEALRAQHPAMLSMADELLTEAEKIVELTGSWRAKFDKLVQELNAHEHGENGLVQDAYEQDVGSKD